MTEITVTRKSLRANLAHYLEQVECGHTVIITGYGKPIAKITKLKTPWQP